MSKSNVIDLTAKIKKNKNVKTEKNSKGETAQVLNFVEKQTEKQNQERRKVTRTVLSQFIGVFVVLNDGILQPISVNDISLQGLSFDLGQEVGQFLQGENVTLRIYVSHDTYFTFNAQISNHRAIEGSGAVRHGAMFKKNTSEEALYHFVRFLENVAIVAKKDKGEKLSGRVD